MASVLRRMTVLFVIFSLHGCVLSSDPDDPPCAQAARGVKREFCNPDQLDHLYGERLQKDIELLCVARMLQCINDCDGEVDPVACKGQNQCIPANGCVVDMSKVI